MDKDAETFFLIFFKLIPGEAFAMFFLIKSFLQMWKKGKISQKTISNRYLSIKANKFIHS